ncbi:hypothetical protein NQ317_015761 [Molorchus minor]|uniref:Oxidoreductase-like domain-containing protein n=1 Tax=Molorchus minor TaxID=1323400 RepID=A0ABQ9K235_9CUCU|nr:hypothetical protein NQ317_015761 [Molorchus minor]
MIPFLICFKYAKLNLKFVDKRKLSLGVVSRCDKDQTGSKDENASQDGKINKVKKERQYPEEPSTCCMSGCANCVWIEYAEALTEYFKDGGDQALKEINEKVTDPNIKSFLLHELRMRNIKPK